MRLQIILAVALFSVLTFAAVAQETTENTEDESKKISETRLFDEFPPVGECELGARVQNLFIELGQNPGAIGYIIVYRGSESLPAAQTEARLNSQIRFLKTRTMFLKLDSSRVEIVDGGFLKKNSLWHEVWIVPEGGVVPQPTNTVEKPILSKEKAFKVDEGYLENSDALIKKPEEFNEEVEQLSEDPAETTEETIETTEIENQVQQTVDAEDEFSEENDPFYWISDYFAEALKANLDARGVVIFYTDEEEYDIAKTRQIIEEGLRNLADKSKVGLENVDIKFGGYRSENKVEYWIVPKGAKEPHSTPEQKVSEETKEN